MLSVLKLLNKPWMLFRALLKNFTKISASNKSPQTGQD